MKNILKEIQKEMDTSNFETMDSAEALEMAELYDSLDAEDFEQMEDAEYAEYLDFLDSIEDAEHKKRRRLRLPTRPKKRLHRTHSKKHGKTKAHAKPLKGRAKLAAIGGGGTYTGKNAPASKALPAFGSKAFINHLMTTSKGDLNITVTRETSKINANLPYILFDLNGYTSAYVSTMKQYLPSGTTMTAAPDPANGDILLTYTNGGNVDIVRISLTGSQISYSEFLQSMNQNFFKTQYIRQEYQNNASLLLQVSQTINFGLLSSLGMNNKNNLLPRSRRLNDDYQTFIINLFLPEQKITSDFSFVQNIIKSADETPVVIAWDVFMSERINLNNI
jgi:hypothetical protein